MKPPPPSFDDIQIRRPELARQVLTLLQAQPGRPIAMFAPRRVGKTHFLDHDLAPLAQAEGWLPVYADLWLQRSAPLEAINHACEEALDDLVVPAGRVGKLAKTRVRKVGALGASIDLDEEPRRRPLPTAPEPRLDALIQRLGATSGKRVLLMLDEAQALAEVSGGEGILAALRAVLHKRRDTVRAVLTGSSQEGLARMVSLVGAPMYQFAQLMDFPPLGDEYLKALADHFGRVHRGRKPLLDDLRRVFAAIGFKPALMRDLVKGMSAEGLTDVDLGLKRMLADDRQIAGWLGLLQGRDAFDRLVLWKLAQGGAPYAGETLDDLERLSGERPTIARVRAAIERLQKAGIVSKVERTVRVEDPLFGEFLRGRAAKEMSG